MIDRNAIPELHDLERRHAVLYVVDVKQFDAMQAVLLQKVREAAFVASLVTASVIGGTALGGYDFPAAPIIVYTIAAPLLYFYEKAGKRLRLSLLENAGIKPVDS